MHWNGYAGSIGAMGGALGLDGAFWWHWLQWLLVCCISQVMPDQKTDDSVLASIVLLPWCAACRVDNTFGLRDVGMSTLSLYRMTPSTVDRLSHIEK